MKNTPNSENQDIKQITFQSKKGHKDQIVDLKQKDENTFFSFGDDLRAKLWDMRTCAGVKLFQLDLAKQEEFAGYDLDDLSGGSIEWIEKHNTLICTAGNKIWTFDDRKCKVVSKEVTSVYTNGVEEDICAIKPINSGDNIVVLDDSGSLTNLSFPKYEICTKIGQAHKLPYAMDVLKKSNGYKVYSSGFDCILTTSDLNNQKVEQQTNIGNLLAQTLGIRGPTPPHVYHISTSQQSNDLLLSLETGHVMSVKSKNTNEVRF